MTPSEKVNEQAARLLIERTELERKEKQALRLMFKCMDMLRINEEAGNLIVPDDLKNELASFLQGRFNGAEEAATYLGLPL